jgi:hypothetical protein
MTTRVFRRALIGLFGVILLLLGFLSFQTWNRKGGHEGSLAQDSSGQPEMGGGQEESAAAPDSQSAGGDKAPDKPSVGKGKSKDKSASKPAAGNEKAEDKLGSQPAAGKEKNGEKSTSEASEGPKTYRVDTKASRVYVRVGPATTERPLWVEGRLMSGKVTPGAGGELVFDMKSFKTTPQQAPKGVRPEGQPVGENEARKVNETLLSADVLDVEKFPTATYEIIIMKPAEKQEAGEPGTYHVNGRLTLHGAEQPLQIEAKLGRTDNKDVLKLSAVFAIRPSAYGVKSSPAPSGQAGVADEMEVLADLSLGPEK